MKRGSRKRTPARDRDARGHPLQQRLPGHKEDPVVGTNNSCHSRAVARDSLFAEVRRVCLWAWPAGTLLGAQSASTPSLRGS